MSIFPENYKKSLTKLSKRLDSEDSEFVLLYDSHLVNRVRCHNKHRFKLPMFIKLLDYEYLIFNDYHYSGYLTFPNFRDSEYLTFPDVLDSRYLFFRISDISGYLTFSHDWRFTVDCHLLVCFKLILFPYIHMANSLIYNIHSYLLGHKFYNFITTLPGIVFIYYTYIFVYFTASGLETW